MIKIITTGQEAMTEIKLYEEEPTDPPIDPDETPLRDRKLFVQPYDLIIKSLIDQIESGSIHLRPLSDKPRFQRRYVWNNKLASLLVESILLNVPIPPIYMSQNDNMELDIIDGQQRVFSLYRFWDNQFKLEKLEVLTELNGSKYFELERPVQLKLGNHSLRCVVITNESHPEIKFEVFQRLNTNTMPLNAQELRNCVYRGALNDLLEELSVFKPWLDIIGRKIPDKRMRDEELILRFFSYQLLGLKSYRTPLKHWLNDAAAMGMKLDEKKIEKLRDLWTSTIEKCLLLFDMNECFRRPAGIGAKRVAINRALMDLTMYQIAKTDRGVVQNKREEFRKAYNAICRDEEFDDLISRSIDHKSRVLRRFELWNQRFSKMLEE